MGYIIYYTSPPVTLLSYPLAILLSCFLLPTLYSLANFANVISLSGIASQVFFCHGMHDVEIPCVRTTGYKKYPLHWMESLECPAAFTGHPEVSLVSDAPNAAAPRFHRERGLSWTNQSWCEPVCSLELLLN